jgi:WD40 repeat protein
MSPNSCLIASCDEKSAKIWDINKQKMLSNYINEHIGNINCIKWSPDNICFASGGKDHKIKLYDIRTKRAIQSIDAHSNSVTSIDFHPSKKYLVSCSLDSTIKIWDLFQNANLYTLYGHEGPIYSVNFNKNGEFICSGGIDGYVYLWRNNLNGNLLEKNEKINGGIAYPDLKVKINIRLI